MKTLTNLTTAAALAALLLAAPALAAEKLDAATKEKIAAKLTAKGYDVRKIQMENGKLEVLAVKNGKKLELTLDDKLNIVKTGDEASEDSEGSEG
jgi:hypothetical protein